ncbi:MAG: DUF1365 domain-containing protein [Rickettsiales bacterium]
MQLYFTKVMHKRLIPTEHGFNYNMYYLALPLSKLTEVKLGWALKFHEKDHGAHTETGLYEWAQKLAPQGFEGEIILVTLPRIFGYVFNPVSFYLCVDAMQNLRHVIAEVNNTFGETHVYVCQDVGSSAEVTTEKLFHVSPFLEREGSYKFRFNYTPEQLGIWIDYYDAAGNKKLITSMLGKFEPLTKKSLRAAFWKYPLITFKTTLLIYYHAVRLVKKKIKYIVKPPQKETKISIAKTTELI